jgi:hypothetical protein
MSQTKRLNAALLFVMVITCPDQSCPLRGNAPLGL